MNATCDIDIAVPVVCLSVRPSITLRYRAKTAKHIVEIPLPPNNLIILVFSPLVAVAKFKRNHP